MVMQLEKVVPFGRSLDEYFKMFNLSSKDLQQRIIGVGDGPASFNAEGTKVEKNITSIDPIYEFSGREIRQRFDQVVDNIIDQVIATSENWVWSYHASPQALKENRIKAIEIFLADYDQGKQEGRYLNQELPCMSFADQSFDLALCSHLLFLYSAHLDQDFHTESIKEMLRVSQEVRIFPLLTLTQETSPYLNCVINEFSKLGYFVEIKKSLMSFNQGEMKCW